MRLFTALFFLLSALTIDAQELGVHADLTGTVETTYEDGSLASTQEYVDGVCEGDFVLYHKNGQIKERGTFKNDKKVGTWERYNEEGVQTALANYVDGMKEGKWMIWDEQGTLRYDMTYSNDKKVDIWYMYDANATLVSTKTYE